MKIVKIIVRMLFATTTVFLLIYTSSQSENEGKSLLEFKYKMIQKIQVDSLASAEKIDLVVDETSKFIESSSRVKVGMRYLSILIGLFGITEIVFLMLGRRRIES